MNQSFFRAARSFLAALVLFGFGHSAMAQVITPQTGWWWNPDESGRGFSVEVQDGVLFFAGFLYDETGRATWYASDLDVAADASGSFASPLTSYSGGQTLSGRYRPISGVADSGKMMTLSFSSATQGMLSWPGGSVPIERFPIVSNGLTTPPPANSPQNGWWWNANESGRGFFIEIQANTLFMAGFMYDDAGNPIWYCTKGAMTSTNSYQGVWNEFGNGQTITGAYKAASVVKGNAGSVSLVFTSPTTATLTLPDGNTVALTRYAFSALASTVKPLSSGTVTLAPGKIDLRAIAGTSANGTVAATFGGSLSGEAYLNILPDKENVFAPIGLVALKGANASNAQISTLSTLAAGRYAGTLAVHVCKNAACTAEYPDSPVSLPYEVKIGPQHVAMMFTPSVLTATARVGAPFSLSADASFGPQLSASLSDLAFSLEDSNDLGFSLNWVNVGSSPTFKFAPFTFFNVNTVSGTLKFRVTNRRTNSEVPGSPVLLPYTITVNTTGKPGTEQYTVGGTINGLGSAPGLVLANHTLDATVINPNATTFTMKTALTSGSTYFISVQSQPTGLTCSVTAGSGTVTKNVNTVVVNCVPGSSSGGSPSGTWTWLGGPNTLAQAGVYGSLGVPMANNNPSARLLAAYWKDTAGNFWLFGGRDDNLYYFNDLWRYDPQSAQWGWMGGSSASGAPGVYGTKGVAAPGNIPCARADASTWVDASGKLWLFGGTVDNAILNDLWVYSPQAGQWTWISGSSSRGASSVYGTQGVESAASVPGARVGAASWIDAAGKLWLFGGSGTNEMWRFNPQTGNWAWMGGSGTPGAAGVYGIKGETAAGNIPPGRTDGVAWTDGANLWLFGGWSAGYFSDVWKYSPQTGMWTWVSGDSWANTAAQGMPGSPASKTVYWSRFGILWAFSGLLPTSETALMRLDTQTGQWTQMGHWPGFGTYGTKNQATARTVPGSRGYSAAWTDDAGRIWLFGGRGYATSVSLGGPLSDLWMYQP